MSTRNNTFIDFLSEEGSEESLYNSGMFFVDFVRGVNRISKVCAQLGYAAEDMISGRFLERMHSDDIETYSRLSRRFHEGNDDELYCEYRLMNARGEWNWILTHATVLKRDENGSIWKIIGFDRLIDNRKKTEALILDQLIEARKTNEINETVSSAGQAVLSDLHLSDNISEGLEKMKGIIDFDFCVLSIDREECCQVITYPEDEIFSVPDSESLREQARQSKDPIIIDSALGGFKSAMAVPLAVKEDSLGSILLFNRKPGVFSGIDLYPVRSFAGILSLVIFNHNEMKGIVDDLERDHLTGFLTRMSFEKSMENMWDDILCGKRKTVFCMIDIDHFKRVNDKYGHQKGDAVIREIAGICRSSMREKDILGRYGGEEFIAVLSDTGIEGAKRTMERIRESIASMVFPGMAGGVTVSIGVSAYAEGDSMESVIKRSDDALYEAKRSGRNRVLCC